MGSIVRSPTDPSRHKRINRRPLAGRWETLAAATEAMPSVAHSRGDGVRFGERERKGAMYRWICVPRGACRRPSRRVVAKVSSSVSAKQATNAFEPKRTSELLLCAPWRVAMGNARDRRRERFAIVRSPADRQRVVNLLTRRRKRMLSRTMGRFESLIVVCEERMGRAIW